MTLIYLTLKPIKEQRHSFAWFIHNLNHNSYMNNHLFLYHFMTILQCKVFIYFYKNKWRMVYDSLWSFVWIRQERMREKQRENVKNIFLSISLYFSLKIHIQNPSYKNRSLSGFWPNRGYTSWGYGVETPPRPRWGIILFNGFWI